MLRGFLEPASTRVPFFLKTKSSLKKNTAGLQDLALGAFERELFCVQNLSHQAYKFTLKDKTIW